MKPEQLITLPKRGIRIIPPQETQANMKLANEGQKVTWSWEEKTRLKQLINCSILEKRYPTREDGARFMRDEVDYDRREELLCMAHELTNHIISSWKRINPNTEIAVILFGSVAKGLVKKADHPDPSNIDLAVIGDISDEERTELYDRIRPKRKDVQRRIIANNPHISPEIKQKAIENQYVDRNENFGNAGVFIQTPEKVKKNNYSVGITYIKSNAQTLYDPSGIWQEIEKETLGFVGGKKKVAV
ncbi:MAG: nucleotidyltransferase domain-containing protein [Candidatus Levybacteria bacterium]|nr:nucleotidyltransferase domain-containing protein [Candidatus Levybacteria bacterium]